MQAVVVDDNKTNVAIFQAILSKIPNLNIKSFINSLDAINYCSDWSSKVDLLIIDYMMPELNGVEFVKMFREIYEHKETPIIMVTALTDKEVRYSALECGVNDFLTKPIDKIELISRAKNMLAIRKAQLIMIDKAAWLASEIEQATKQIKQRDQEAILRLCKASEYRDPETGQHIIRMAAYCELIAKNLGLDRAECELILQAAPMHDIGKVGIADSILTKPGKLTDEEFDIMRTHAQIGYDILNGSASDLLQMAAEIALTHHEKFDGTGYPNKLQGNKIPISGRICAVADVFDALTSERPYKHAWNTEDAILMLTQNSTKHFDKNCVDAFLSNIQDILHIKNQNKD